MSSRTYVPVSSSPFPAEPACFWPLCLCLLENNKPPQADAGPDKELTLPVDSTTLDGSKSSDDQKIISYLWEKTQWVLTQNLYCCNVSRSLKTRTYLCLRVHLLLLAYPRGMIAKETLAVLNFNSTKMTENNRCKKKKNNACRQLVSS